MTEPESRSDRSPLNTHEGYDLKAELSRIIWLTQEVGMLNARRERLYAERDRRIANAYRLGSPLRWIHHALGALEQTAPGVINRALKRHGVERNRSPRKEPQP